jgi:hypothetical protein
MDTRPLFLDTNVYMSYAINDQIEKFHSQCCTVFDAPNSRHTSFTVKQELEKKIRNRRTLYREVLQHTISKKSPESFSPSSGNEADKAHGMKVLQVYEKGSLDMEYLRTLHTLLERGILDALANRTTKPLVERSTDAVMKDDFRFIMDIHPPDNEVLADFVDWSMPTQGACFITCDGGIDKKKDKIKEYIRDNKGECDHLSLWYITSAARRLSS